MRKIFSIGKYAVMTVLILFLTFLITGNTAKADVAKHNNLWENDYYPRNLPSLSFITPTADGGYMIFDAGSSYRDSEGYLVEYYDSNYNFVRSRTIPVELPLFGGFYSDGSNYYLVTGQDNPEESDSLEVYRVTKYNTSWTRRGAVSLKDCNTTEPFASGSVDMASAGGKLFVRTCHKMYKSSDGINHQSNWTMLINADNMKMLDSPGSGNGYCSHSFNQLAVVDGKNFISADHGDGYPRGIKVTRYNNAVSSGALSGEEGVDAFLPYSFSGGIGDNYTGASIGGLGVSSSSYLVSANSIQQGVSGSSTRNILIATVNKSTGETGARWITSYPEGDESCTTPYLIKINDNKFLVLWSKGREVQYAFVDGTGTIQGSVHDVFALLSDCRPVLSDGNVVWYTYDGTQINFFEINGSTGEFVSKNPINIRLTAFYEIPDTVYTGSKIEPKTSLALGEKELKRGVDYTVKYQNNLNAGEAKIICTGKGSFNGSLTLFFYIYPKNISKLTISPIPDIPYTGEVVYPDVEIKDGDITLVKGQDYATYYPGDCTVGRKKLTVYGYGNYTGEVDVPFKIVKADEIDLEITLANKANGVSVSWEAVKNAAKYRVFRKKAGDSSWEKLGTTTSLKYSDKKAVFSETYLYSVRAMTKDGNYMNRYGNGTEIKHIIGAPKLTLTNSEDGIDITWKPVTNAAKYKVYVKNSKGTWTRLATISSGTAYTDTATKNGKSYTYSVVGLDAGGHVMNENGDGFSLVRNNAFVNVEADCTTDGLILFWDAYESAAKYRVYRKNSSGKWTKIATIAETVYTDADAAVNAENVYAVLAVDSDGKLLTDYGNGKTVTYIIPPTAVEAVAKTSGVRVEWASVIKAERYALYRRTKSTDWTKVGATSGLSYTDKSAESGKTYFYSVIALDANGKTLNDYGEGTKIKYVKPVSDDALIENLPELEGTGVEVEEEVIEETIEEEATEEETTEEVSEEDTEEISKEDSEEVSEDNKEDTVEETTEEITEDISEEAAETFSEETEETIEEKTEEDSEETVSEGITEGTSEETAGELISCD